MAACRKSEILIVEDDNEIKEMLCEFFMTHDFRCSGAENGKRAMELFAEKKFSLIFLNYELPDTNGYELYKKIRESNKTVPIIFHTSHYKALRNKIKNDQKVGFIDKPTLLTTLYDTAMKLLNH